MTRIIDLSVPMSENSGEPAPMKMERILHSPGAELICSKLNNELEKYNDCTDGDGKIKKKLEPMDFPNGEFLSNEIVTATTHTGTHVDAPWHFGSTCDGRPAKKASEIPLELCFGDGVLLDVTFRKEKELVEASDIQNALLKIDYRLKERDIVLVRTGADAYWGTPKYFNNHPGMSRDATKYLVDQGVKLIGIDSYGFDRPFLTMAWEFLKTADPSHLWPAHFFGREIEYYHIERLTNLEKIPAPNGFKVACFPIKIENAGAAWTRAVAIVE